MHEEERRAASTDDESAGDLTPAEQARARARAAMRSRTVLRERRGRLTFRAERAPEETEEA